MNAALTRALSHVRALHLHLPKRIASPIQSAVERAAARSPTALSILYDTDKGPQGHSYTDTYRELIGPMRSKPITALEIGIDKGASLRLWRRFLPKATVVGIDLEPPATHLPGIEMHAGDQSDENFLGDIIDRYGGFDLVIDDGSHIASHIRASFDKLFPALRPDGWYVIEDLWTAYHAGEYEGGPSGTPGTAIELIKGLIDRTQTESGVSDVAELHLFDSIAFIRKAGPHTS
jgi:hypothetical protein